MSIFYINWCFFHRFLNMNCNLQHILYASRLNSVFSLNNWMKITKLIVIINNPKYTNKYHIWGWPKYLYLEIGYSPSHWGDEVLNMMQYFAFLQHAKNTFRLEIVSEWIFSVERRVAPLRRDRRRREVGRPVRRLWPGLVTVGQNRRPVRRLRPAETRAVPSRQRVRVVRRQVVEVSPRQRICPVWNRIVSDASHPGQREIALRLAASATEISSW